MPGTSDNFATWYKRHSRGKNPRALLKLERKGFLEAWGPQEEDMLLVEVGAGVAAGVGVPPEVEGDGFSFDIETMVGKICSVPETQGHRRLCGRSLCGNHALLEEMKEILRVAP